MTANHTVQGTNPSAINRNAGAAHRGMGTCTASTGTGVGWSGAEEVRSAETVSRKASGVLTDAGMPRAVLSESRGRGSG
ncbi:hypothetical protein acdb102_00770 [Acidothermaceae bacterium B102]|nr:hypothetical protein acdb102_00770 [Acidothermaceae bacterium B102]